MKRLALLFFFFASPCFAAGYSAGAMLGSALVGSGVGLQFAGGLEVTKTFSPRFVLGGFVLREGLGSGSVDDPSQNLNVSLSSGMTVIAVHPRFCFTSDLTGFDLGAIVGLSLVSESSTVISAGTTTNSISESSTRLVFGPSLGYSMPLNANWVFTPRIDYLLVQSGGGLSGFNSATLLAVIRYLF